MAKEIEVPEHLKERIRKVLEDTDEKNEIMRLKKDELILLLNTVQNFTSSYISANPGFDNKLFESIAKRMDDNINPISSEKTMLFIQTEMLYESEQCNVYLEKLYNMDREFAKYIMDSDKPGSKTLSLEMKLENMEEYDKALEIENNQFLLHFEKFKYFFEMLKQTFPEEYKKHSMIEKVN